MTGQITTIRRADIPEQGLQLELNWNEALLDTLPQQECRPDLEGPVQLTAGLNLDGSRVVLEGTCRAQGIVECVLCLERFVYPLTVSFRCVFQPLGMKDLPGNQQLEPGDMEVIYYDGERIDLTAPVFEQIHLGLPAYPHCSPECKGLCTQCGANLNSGACVCRAESGVKSPFAGLAKLKKKA